MPLELELDHDADAGAPRYRLPSTERLRFAVLTAATLVLAGGVVLAVAWLLPVLAGWVLPALLTVLTTVFLALGRLAARGGSTAAARAWAAWAGVTAALGVPGFVNLAGFGGALVAVLLVVVAVNAAIALWFRSPVHFVAVQLGTLAWGVVAHVFGTAPWAVLVAAVAGAWWLRTVGPARPVAVTSTIVLPVAVTLLVHPLTHDGAAVDAADVAVLTGAVAAAVTCSAVVTRSRGVSTLWVAARRTAVLVLVLQVLAGTVPAVVGFLAPSRPWPSELLACAVVLGSAAMVAVCRTRPGVVTVLVLCAVQLAEVAAALTLGPAAATVVGVAGLLGVAVVHLARGGHVATWLAVLTLPVLGALLLDLPTPAVAGVLVIAGATVAVVLATAARAGTGALTIGARR